MGDATEMNGTTVRVGDGTEMNGTTVRVGDGTEMNGTTVCAGDGTEMNGATVRAPVHLLNKNEQCPRSYLLVNKVPFISVPSPHEL